jgi:hypothetical protein
MSLRLITCITLAGWVGSLGAQPIEEKLLKQLVLDSADIARSGAFDSLSFTLDLRLAYVDTTLVLSDSVLYSIIMVGNASGTGSLQYLMSFDRVNKHPIEMVHVCSEPDIDQSLRRYSLTTLSVGHDRSVGAIEYDCRTRKDRYGNRDLVEMRAVRRRNWDVAADGRITGGIWIIE